MGVVTDLRKSHLGGVAGDRNHSELRGASVKATLSRNVAVTRRELKYCHEEGGNKERS